MCTETETEALACSFVLQSNSLFFGDPAPLSLQPAPETWDKVSVLVRERRARDDAAAGGRAGLEISVELEDEPKATCGVGVAGLDIDPFGNVQACMHVQESAGNLHQHSIEEIWHHAPLFTRAPGRALEAAAKFGDQPLRQLGAPLFCLAVEENCNKGCWSCSRP